MYKILFFNYLINYYIKNCKKTNEQEKVTKNIHQNLL
jgi:hypothetical protein